MTFPYSTIESSILLLGAAAVAWSGCHIIWLLGRWRRGRPEDRRVRNSLAPWARRATVPLTLLAGVGVGLGAVTWTLRGSSAGTWVAAGFLFGALPGSLIGAVTDLVEVAAAWDRSEGLLAELPGRVRRATAAAGWAGPTLAGGAVALGFVLLFAWSDVSLPALLSFSAGASLASLARGSVPAIEDPRAVDSDAEEGAVAARKPGWAAFAGADSLVQSSLATYGTLAVLVTAATLVIEGSPYTRFLVPDSLLLPAVILIAGVWAPLAGRLVSALLVSRSDSEATFAGVGTSLAALVLLATTAVATIVGPGWRTILPVAIGGSTACALLICTPRVTDGRFWGGRLARPAPTPGGRARKVLGVASGAGAAIAGVLALGLTVSYLIAGAPTGGSLGFSSEVAEGGFLFAGVTLAASVPSVAAAAGCLAMARRPARASALERAGTGTPAHPERIEDGAWAQVLLGSFAPILGVVAAGFTLLGLASLGPRHAGVSPAIVATHLTPANGLFTAGACLGIAAGGFVGALTLPRLGRPRVEGRASAAFPREDGPKGWGWLRSGALWLATLGAPILSGLALGVVGLVGFVVGAVGVAFPLSMVWGIAGPLFSRGPIPQLGAAASGTVGLPRDAPDNPAPGAWVHRNGLALPSFLMAAASITLLLGAWLLTWTAYGIP